MPLSRHRKSKTRKKPKGLYANAPSRNPAAKARNLRTVAILVVAVLAVAFIAWILLRQGGQAGPEIVTASGLKYVDLVVGDGPSPQRGQRVSVHYTGTLLNGEVFDTSLKPQGKPMEFQFGVDPMIKGWDEGISTMKVGGKRKLTVPPALGYGPMPREKIPPNSTLQFEIELLEIK